MKRLLLLSLILFSGTSFAQVNVTFRVNMKGYQQSFVTANVNGTFNNWCGACNPLTDANNDSIWEATISLPPGRIEYKFTVDGWAAQENLTPGSPCTVTASGFTNRVYTIVNEATLPVDCWGKCGACGILPPVRQRVSLPITWQDTATVNYTTADFGGTFSSLAADPADPTKVALSILKTDAAEVWAGTTLGTAAGFATNIPFNQNSTEMQARVYSPDSGVSFKLKAENSADGTIAVETDAVVSAANSWQVLTFNFANHSGGTPAINYNSGYNKISIFPNFGVAGSAAGNKTYFIGAVSFGNPASTKEQLANQGFALFPNPGSGQFSMFSTALSGQRVDIKIYDAVGRVVFSEQAIFNGTDKKIDLSNARSGVYMVSAKSSAGDLVIKRLIVE